jgi:hypothetical protein
MKALDCSNTLKSCKGSTLLKFASSIVKTFNFVLESSQNQWLAEGYIGLSIRMTTPFAILTLLDPS